jgi:hypothetical protein
MTLNRSMTLNGHPLIAGETAAGTSGTTYGIDPATNEQLEPGIKVLKGPSGPRAISPPVLDGLQKST